MRMSQSPAKQSRSGISKSTSKNSKQRDVPSLLKELSWRERSLDLAIREYKSDLRERALERAWAKASFNETCFLDTNGNSITNNWHHVEWFVEIESFRYLLEMAAREHAKTEIFAKADPLFELAANPNIRILLISAVYPQSQQRTRVLREHILGNPRYKEWCEDHEDDGFVLPEIIQKDSDYAFWIKRDRILKEPTVVSTYALGPIAGGRYDLIIVDDLVDLILNSNTPDKRAKLRKWWEDDVLNSSPSWGKIRVIGTPRHHRDLHTDIEKDKRFVVVKRPGVDEAETGYGHLGYKQRNIDHGLTLDNEEGWSEEDLHCLWPSMHDYEAQMQKKSNTPDSYLSQQQLILIPETGLVYRKPLVDAAFERGKEVAYNPQAEQYIGFDPGYSNRASMLCIQERTGDRIEMWREHSFTELSDEEIVEVMIEHIREYRVRAVFFDAEDPGFGRALANAIDSHGLRCMVQPVPFGKYKRTSIKTTRWLLNSDRVAWSVNETIEHRPGKSKDNAQLVPSLFGAEMKDYAMKPGEDDEPIKDDDHGPDGWHAYVAKHREAWARATGQDLTALDQLEEQRRKKEVGGLIRERLGA
jgi:hypothetical protein